MVAPARPVAIDGRDRTAWWRIDPTTGETVAVTEDGLHGDTEEYAMIVYRRQNENTKLYSVYRVSQGEWQLEQAGATFKELGTATQRFVGSFRIYLGLN